MQTAQPAAAPQPSPTPASPTDVQMDRAEWFRQAWRPSNYEGAYEITRIEGEIPRALYGTLYRNGPSQRMLPAEGYQAMHLFDGDALVHAFRFDDGRCHYTGRFVENETYVAEQAAGRFAADLLGARCPDPIDAIPMRQQHNTNIVHHGGKLMAMVENAWPYQIDERTLDPVGGVDFGVPALGMSVTAHPKIDGRTGQMIIHGYQPVEPYVQLYVVEPDGTASVAESVDVPYPAMMHDIAITENYAILLLVPIVIDPMKLIERGFGDAISYKPEAGLKFGVRPRAAGGQVQWFEAPTTGFIFHPGNAYEEDGKIFMDACTYLQPDLLLENLSTWRSGKLVGDFAARPFLYELDLATGRCFERQLDDRGCEFPRLDERLTGYKNRWGYAAMNRGDEIEGTWSTLVRYDRTGGPLESHEFGRWEWPSEPVFVPRARDAAEDDGFVLATVYDGTDDSSYLAVLDAANLSAEPLAKCHLEHRIPMGFHGNFAAGVV